MTYMGNRHTCTAGFSPLHSAPMMPLAQRGTWVHKMSRLFYPSLNIEAEHEKYPDVRCIYMIWYTHAITCVFTPTYCPCRSRLLPPPGLVRPTGRLRDSQGVTHPKNNCGKGIPKCARNFGADLSLDVSSWSEHVRNCLYFLLRNLLPFKVRKNLLQSGHSRLFCGGFAGCRSRRAATLPLAAAAVL